MNWLGDRVRRVFSSSSLPLADLDPEAEERARMVRYQRNWRIYKGENLKGAVNEDGTPLADINLLAHNIDKVLFYAWGSDYKLTNAEYQGYLDAANEAWGRNKVEKLLRMGQFGSVTGDSFLLVAPVKAGTSQLAFNEKTATIEDTTPQVVSIVAVNSNYCRPYYDPFDMDKLVRLVLKVPLTKVEDDGSLSSAYSCYSITDKEIIIWEADTFDTEVPQNATRIENPIGVIFGVHVRNYPLGDCIYGKDDIRVADRLNEEYVQAVNNVGGIIKYHGDPITLIFGAKASNLKKGPNKIWGNLPKDGKVENLTMDTDLTAIETHIDRLKEAVHVVTGVPEIAQGTKQSISNTSGVALHTMYLPLIEKAVLKHITYTPKLLEIVTLVLRWRQQLGNSYTVKDGVRSKPDGRAKKLTEEDYQAIIMDTVFKAELPLPKDRLIEVQIQSTKVTAGLQTRRDALVELGDPKPDEKLEKIRAEKEEWGQMDARLAKAAKPSIESGLSDDTGTHKGESEEQQGRPKNTKE